ncbi:tetratricopeptide repeat protein [Desulforhopalus sp. IMCC35007]|nr:tetratricopeptide repeat protein [Desulforhopalus sp. IMCC35007]
MRVIVIEKFPLPVIGMELLVEDYFVFSSSFTEILHRHIPTIKEVDIFESEGDFLASREIFSQNPEFVEYFQALKKEKSPYIINNGFVLLGLVTKDNACVVVVLAGADPLFLQKMSNSWLDEKIVLIQREFHLLKQARVDAQTGLLNLTNLYSLLDSASVTQNLMLALVELPPVSTSFRRNIKYTHRCVSLLKTFIRGRSILHYIGHNTFALVLQRGEEQDRSAFESSLVSYLKTEGCARVHVGSSVMRKGRLGEEDCPKGINLLDEAWTALNKASKRGPFSFCDYTSLAFPEKQPLAHPDATVVRKISRWCKPLNSFSLVLFRCDSGQGGVVELIEPLVCNYKSARMGRDLYVLCPEMDKLQITNWVREILGKVSALGDAVSISAGVTCYPFSDISISETPFCCKKALLHAEFFGPRSYAIFDHVTFNISGDVYFGEGDFNLAVKEYRRGLKSCAGDVNLHNSLGVTLALMNRVRQADDCFRSALATDKDNFMALYNLGLSKQAQGSNKEAVKYMDKAFQIRDGADVDPRLISDLKLQLGVLCCETGLYDSSICYIEEWLTDVKETVDTGKVHYFLGVNYFNLNEPRRAIQSLERALRFNGFDDRALNLLGRLYFQEQEGTDVALSLCLKSIELDPDNTEYKLYLAEIYVSIGAFFSAQKLLKVCLKKKQYRAFAQLLMAEGYVKEGMAKRAEGWFVKALKQEKLEKHIKNRVKHGLQSCQAIQRNM